MTQQVGGAFGLAVITAVATSSAHGATQSLAAVDDGFRAALIVAAAIAAAGSVAQPSCSLGESSGVES